MTINYDNATPHQVLEMVLQGESIDGACLDFLNQHLNVDWIIDLDEAEFLFKVNQAMANREDISEDWVNFLIDNISKLVLFDLHTPGEIDQSEGDWLGDMLERYGCGNDGEKQLIEFLHQKSSKISGKFSEIR